MPPPLPAQSPANEQEDLADLPELSLDDDSSPYGMVPVVQPAAPPPPMPVPIPQPQGEQLTLADGQAPLLLDVTPQSLRIETVAGFTEVIIERNAAIPVEQSRLFTTSRDFQDVVRARVCQGESRKLAENQELGVLELQGIRSGQRGKAQIEVTFLLDADGTLRVSAKDMHTGAAETIRINLVGAVQEDEILRMQQRQQALVG